MANVDAQAGAARYAAKTTNRPGMCLAECQVAMAAPPSIGKFAGQYPTAYSAWLHDTNKHTDAKPPRGALVYFGPSPTRTDKNKNAGDVCISLGPDKNGVYLLRCSDGGGSGRMATMTIAARAKQIARPYLGWVAPIFLGHTLVNLGPVSTAPAGTKLVTGDFIEKELGLALTKELQTQLGVTPDGQIGPATTKAWQTRIGIKVPDTTWEGAVTGVLQTFLSIKPDNLWGDATTVAVKSAINAKKFAKVVTPPPVVTPPVYVPPTEAQYKALVAERDALVKSTQAQAAELLVVKAKLTAGATTANQLSASALSLAKSLV